MDLEGNFQLAHLSNILHIENKKTFHSKGKKLLLTTIQESTPYACGVMHFVGQSVISHGKIQ